MVGQLKRRKQRNDPDQYRCNGETRKQSWLDSRTNIIKNQSHQPLHSPYALNIDADEQVYYRLKDKDYVRWPRQMDLSTNDEEYCEFHHEKVHATVDCKALRYEIKLLKRGHLTEFICERGCNIYELSKEGNMAMVHCQDECAKERTPSIPIIFKQVGMISGGSTYSGDTGSFSREHIRIAKFVAPAYADLMDAYYITFTSDTVHVFCMPHDNALVVTLPITNCEVKIFVDSGSSIDELFVPTLEKMGIDKSQIEKTSVILTGCNRKSTPTVCTIKLPVSSSRENKMSNFLVLDCPYAYNIILGRPWIHKMQAIPSMHQQVVPSPTKKGIKEVRSDQAAACQCNSNTLQYQKI